MKFLTVLAAVFASAMMTSEAVVTKPDAVLAQLDTLETEVFGYQAEVQAQIKTLRDASGSAIAEYYNRTLVTIKKNIQEIAVSDVAVSAALDAEVQTACITNLKNFIEQILELSGYATSNCIEIKEDTTAVIPADYLTKLDALEKDVNILAQIFINALIGRNIFTESDAIVERVGVQLEEKKAEYLAILAELSETSKGFSTNLDSDTATLDTCFNEIDSSISSGIDVVQAQLPVCTKFGARGARSASLPNPKDFFPQL